MDFKVFLSPDALSDLERIVAYIALDCDVDDDDDEAVAIVLLFISGHNGRSSLFQSGALNRP
jgi:hypothetical protein